MDFWTWLVSVGAISGDPTYYSSGKAAPGEYTHAMQVAVDFFKANPAQAPLFYSQLASAGLFQGDPTYYSSGQAQPDEFTNLVNVVGTALAGAGGQVATAPGSGPDVVSGETPATPSDPIFGAPVAGQVTTIKAGGTLYRIADPGTGTVTYQIVYPFEGVNLAFRIGDETDFLTAFPDGAAAFQAVLKVNQTEWENLGALGVGTLDDVIDVDGTPLGVTLVNNLRDYGLEALPDWIRNDPAALAVSMTAASEGWSAGRTMTELAKTSGFTDRFVAWDWALAQAGGDNLAAMTLYTGTENQFRSLLSYYRGPEANLSPEYLGSLMSSGWTAEAVTPILAAERTVKADPAILEATNRLLTGAGMAPIGPVGAIALLASGQMPDDQANALLDSVDLTALLGGNDPTAVFDLLNDAMTLSALEDEGLIGLDLAFVRDLRNETGGLVDKAAVGNFASTAAINVLRFGADIFQTRYGLTEESVIAAAAGRPDPEGRASSEIAEIMARIVRERQAAPDSLSDFGAVQRSGGGLAIPGISNL